VSLPQRVSTHPLGCHRRRIRDEVVFDKFIEVLVSGTGYERVADMTCSATTLRRRRDEWIAAGEALRLAALAAYDRMIGLSLERPSADGCQTRAPSDGECAGKSPVDRAKQGVKRSQLTEAYGIPLITEPAPANKTAGQRAADPGHRHTCRSRGRMTQPTHNEEMTACLAQT